MQKIATRTIVIMAAAMCANVMAMGARGNIVGRLGIARQFVQLVDTSSNFCTDHDDVLRYYCHDVGKVLRIGNKNKSAAAFMTSSASVRRMCIGNDQQLRRRHQQPHQVIICQQQRRHRSSSTQVNDADTGEFYANSKTFPDFASLGITSPALLRRLTSPPLNLKRPSAVQAAVFETISRGNNDIIVGAETGESLSIG
jgi:hypothetical protein